MRNILLVGAVATLGVLAFMWIANSGEKFCDPDQGCINAEFKQAMDDSFVLTFKALRPNVTRAIYAPKSNGAETEDGLHVAEVIQNCSVTHPVYDWCDAVFLIAPDQTELILANCDYAVLEETGVTRFDYVVLLDANGNLPADRVMSVDVDGKVDINDFKTLLSPPPSGPFCPE